MGAISFNANKIITTGSGGMILTNNYNLAKKAKYLTTQAKDDSIFLFTTKLDIIIECQIYQQL